MHNTRFNLLTNNIVIFDELITTITIEVNTQTHTQRDRETNLIHTHTQTYYYYDDCKQLTVLPIRTTDPRRVLSIASKPLKFQTQVNAT